MTELRLASPSSEPHCPRCGTETTWNHYEDHGVCPGCVDNA